ncbi:cbb3-type cytochrome c oxidase N-terminal domain-containing protein [Faecalibacter rhinopitheci]|uniref:C-type cytochrome n=1 Tax=Faecalibacter rhinopitheci TaxID=2779678 RepID=A0A8J7G857_9FLAO|nr:cbb3-type cytochrome c oxidase N-terminal domain-containing protein [Faecalibacter rhinopitheci]MBF0597035.1 c-type cytochrome [Faecalibacter rhinopitheci]MBQ0147702.1 c-type cytochrome [Candidatus Onthonaster equi]
MRQRTPAYIFIPLTMIAVILAFTMVTPVDVVAEPGFNGMVNNLITHLSHVIQQGIVWAVIAIALVMLLIINALNRVVEAQKFKQLSEEEKQQYLEDSKIGFFNRLFSSASKKQTAEEEEAIIIDHGFDGIKELDNALPQWWLSLFYFGVVFCITYVLSYAFTDFAHPVSEFEAEMAYLDERDMKWAEANDITIEGAVNKSNDPAIVEEGGKIFKQNCVQCHLEGGRGGIGPNLTDDYWINHEQNDSLFLNIYDIVYNGAPHNPQMRPFGQRKELSGLAIEKVASYVYHINQVEKSLTEADGAAAPQGDLVEKWKQK